MAGIGDLDIAIGGGERSRADIVLLGRVADSLGVGNLWITEGTGRDAFSLLTQIALATDRIGLGTGIVNVFGRTPSTLAQAAASLLEVMDGDRRFNLGLGTSGRALMEKYHGVAFDRPITRLREAVQIIDHAFRTGHLPDGGEIFDLAGLPLGITAPRERLRIYVAGLTPKSLETTGRFADGWLPIWPSLRRGGELIQTLRDAARDAGRPRPVVAGYLYGGVGSAPEVHRSARDTLAWYVAANGTAYRKLFERYGYGEQVRTICDLWESGDRAAARRSVDEAMLADTTLIGEPKEFLTTVDRFVGAGIDRPVLRLPRQLSTPACVEMLAALAQHSA